jgi:hypothetical protein
MTESMNGKELPESNRIFRYWVEVRELKSGSLRKLSLHAVANIPLIKDAKEAQRLREEILQLKDGSATLEAKSLDDLAAQLRQRYPDEAYQRTLHRERDREAEERRAEAMNGLIRILAEEAVNRVIAEETGEGADCRDNGKRRARKGLEKRRARDVSKSGLVRRVVP